MSILAALPDWVKLVGGVVALLTTVVAFTVYLTRLKLEGSKRLKDAEAVVSKQKAAIALLEESSQALNQSVALLREGREHAATIILDINRLMSEGKHLISAAAESVLIPDPFDADSLVFLVAHGSASQQIKHLRVPVDRSVAGKVLTTGRPIVYAVDSGEKHYEDPDTKAAFQSETILSVPLSVGGRIVGVLQFVNRSDGGLFTLDDSERVRSQCNEIAYQVDRLVADTAALKSLGVVQPLEVTEGTFLFLDLTRSSELFALLPPADVLLILNEYYDRIISRALREGATLDRLLGDGMLLRFNIPKRVNQHAAAAVQCALALQREFAALRDEWLRIGKPVKALTHRIGIASGTVIAGQIGHPQFLSYTVIGKAVNEASGLCEEARAFPSGIAVSEVTHRHASPHMADTIRFVAIQGSEGVFMVELVDQAQPSGNSDAGAGGFV